MRGRGVAELEVQAALMDAMGLGRESVVVLHVGGAAGGLAAGADRFLRGFELLSERAPGAAGDRERRPHLRARGRDRAWLGVRGVPVVFDIHHHHCHDPARHPRPRGARARSGHLARASRPKIHFSSPRLGRRRKRAQGGTPDRAHARCCPTLRLHADLIDPIGLRGASCETPRTGLDFDVMLEAKAKDLALLRLREQLTARGLGRPLDLLGWRSSPER